MLDTRDPAQVPINNPGNVVNCNNFATWADANLWFQTYVRFGDPAELDGNDDGVPCESLPGNPGHPVTYPNLYMLGNGGIFRLPITTTASPPAAWFPPAQRRSP